MALLLNLGDRANRVNPHATYRVHGLIPSGAAHAAFAPAEFIHAEFGVGGCANSRRTKPARPNGPVVVHVGTSSLGGLS